MLNAFRHHWIRHPRGRLHWGCLCSVLNAFRHHWIRHNNAGNPRVTITNVLNAFRHHWIRHYLEVSDNLSWIMCSTPFGITGFGTPNFFTGITKYDACSTPFGITGFGTWTCLRDYSNADCAQRLSASLDSAHQRRGSDNQQGPVLNAFRHHWIRHTVGLTGPRAGKVCSTPFGITGFGTVRSPPRPAVAFVLNAFRHHWIRHIPEAGVDNISLGCSTPFGITGFGTRSAEGIVLHSQGVLNAFRHHWIRHVQAARLGTVQEAVLNAFRHHWIRHINVTSEGGARL